MIFCGDMSVPNDECCRKLSDSMDKTGLFKDQTVIINLEGVLLGEQPNDCFWKVYNDKSVIDLKKHCGQLIFCLANNHMYDFPEQIGNMKKILDNVGISYFGLVENGKAQPLEFEDNGEMYAIFGHCWEIYTKTNCNNITNDRVFDCCYDEFYKTVTSYIVSNPERKVIVYMHWNFDMEQYPQPAYKRLAYELIDAGAETIIGNHPHVENEVEIYNGKVIAYALGNFYMPDGYFFNGNLRYPPKSHTTLIINKYNKKHKCYRLLTDFNNEALQVMDDIVLEQQIDAYNLDEYGNYFKKHRIKHKLTPIFYEYKGLLTNLKTKMVIMKIKLIRFYKIKIAKLER